MRLRTWTATSTSVARHPSTRVHSPSPIARLKREIAVSAPSTPGVPGSHLESLAAVLGDAAQVAVALRGRGLGRGARHRGGAQRPDDGGVRVADADAGGDAFLVIGAVGGEGGERVLDPVEQVPDLQAVVHVPGGQVRFLGSVLDGGGKSEPVRV